MKYLPIIAAIAVPTLIVALWLLLTPPGHSPESSPGTSPGTSPGHSPGEAGVTLPPVRIAIIPERDIFEQRRRYRALADYLTTRLGRPVKLLTSRTYEGALQDLHDGEADGAFLGSLVAALAVDRLGVRVLVRPEFTNGVSTYYGIVFVRDDSPILSIADLRGKRMAMVRATTGGHLTPVYMSAKAGLSVNCCQVVWAGTHDEAVQMVIDGNADAGAAKNTRVEYVEQQNGLKLRRLAQSKPVPENTLVVRSDLDDATVQAMRIALLEMAEDPAGQAAVEAMGIRRFIPCDVSDFRNVMEMARETRAAWSRMGIDGPPPGGGD